MSAAVAGALTQSILAIQDPRPWVARIEPVQARPSQLMTRQRITATSYLQRLVDSQNWPANQPAKILPTPANADAGKNGVPGRPTPNRQTRVATSPTSEASFKSQQNMALFVALFASSNSANGDFPITHPIPGRSKVLAVNTGRPLFNPLGNAQAKRQTIRKANPIVQDKPVNRDGSPDDEHWNQAENAIVADIPSRRTAPISAPMETPRTAATQTGLDDIRGNRPAVLR